MDISIKHLYGQTSAVWTAPYLLKSWVKDYCQLAFHVSHSVQQGNNWEMKILEIFGQKQGELFGKLDQGSFVLKMFQPYLMEIENDNNQPMPSLFLKNLPKWGWITGSDMELWGQKTPMPHTNGKGSGSWPTPRAIYGEHPGMTDPNHLTGAVQKFPTPTASEKSGINPSTGQGAGLSKTVNMWPTPTVADANKVTSPYGQLGLGNHPDIIGRVEREKTTKSVKGDGINTRAGTVRRKEALSPEWVEWLMGVPAPGWTSLEPLPKSVFENWKKRMMDGTWWKDEHGLPRIVPREKGRVDRLKALGNGIVPRVIPVFLNHLKGTGNGHI